MKRIMLGMAALTALCTFSSCLKDKDYDNGLYGSNPTSVNDKPFVQLLEGGLRQFNRANLVFADPTAASDSSTFSVYYVGPASAGAEGAKAPQDITVTFDYDAAAITAYNADSNNVTKYEKLPDSVFTFTQKTVVIKAGTDVSPKVAIYFKPAKIDPTKLYLLPISIKTVSGGLGIAANNQTIYYHVIGNPLAGNYQDYGQRYNYTGTVAWAGPAAGLGLATAPGVPPAGVPAGGTLTNNYNMVITWLAVDAQTVEAPMGNVPDPVSGSAYYILTGNVGFSSITYDFASTFNSGYSNINKYIRGYVAPTATQKPAFRLITHYNNTTGGAGSDRIIDETFIHQ